MRSVTEAEPPHKERAALAAPATAATTAALPAADSATEATAGAANSSGFISASRGSLRWPPPQLGPPFAAHALLAHIPPVADAHARAPSSASAAAASQPTQAAPASTNARAAAAHADEPSIHPTHVVQWYESDAYLMAVLVEFVQDGQRHGAGVLLLLSHPHLAIAMEHLKQAAGLDTAQAIAEGWLDVVDGDTFLQSVISSVPAGGDFAARFRARFIEMQLAKAAMVMTRREPTLPKRPLRVLSEMYPILLRRGFISEAMALETWCEEIGRATGMFMTHVCSLDIVRAHAASDAAAQDVRHTPLYRSVCLRHTHVHAGDAVETITEACEAVYEALQRSSPVLPFALLYLGRPDSQSQRVELQRKVRLGLPSPEAAGAGAQEATQRVLELLVPARIRVQPECFANGITPGDVPFTVTAEDSNGAGCVGWDRVASVAVRRLRALTVTFADLPPLEEGSNPPALSAMLTHLQDGSLSAHIFPVASTEDVAHGVLILGVVSALYAQEPKYAAFVRLMAAQVVNYLQLSSAFHPLARTAPAALVPCARLHGLPTTVPLPLHHKLAQEMLTRQMRLISDAPPKEDAETRELHFTRLHKLLSLSAPNALASLKFERVDLAQMTASMLAAAFPSTRPRFDASALPRDTECFVDRLRWEEVVVGLLCNAIQRAGGRTKEFVARLAINVECSAVRFEVEAGNDALATGASPEEICSGSDMRWVAHCALRHGAALHANTEGVAFVDLPIGHWHLPAHRVVHPSVAYAAEVSLPLAFTGCHSSCRLLLDGGSDMAESSASAASLLSAVDSSRRSEATQPMEHSRPLLLLAPPSENRDRMVAELQHLWPVSVASSGEELRQLLAEPAAACLARVLLVDSTDAADVATVRAIRQASPCTVVLQLVDTERMLSVAELEALAVFDDTLSRANLSYELHARVRVCLELATLRSSVHEYPRSQSSMLDADAEASFAAQQHQRTLTAERQQRVAMQLYTDNCHLYSRLQLSHASLEAAVALRTAELERAKQDAEKATRIKSEFLSNMSHELRTPMNAVLGISRLLQSTLLSTEQEQYVQMIANSGHLLLTIINDILDYSKIEAGSLRLEPKVTRLVDVVETAVHLCYASAAVKGLDLSYWIQPDAPSYFRFDCVRVQQVLLNLISNAIKFTAKGSVKLDVSAQPVSEERDSDAGAQSAAAAVALQPGETLYELTVRVEDTGIGIKESDASLLFQSFSQAKDIAAKYGGTGLGLVISRRLCESMGGGIRMESELGQGSSFIFHIRAPTLEDPATRESRPVVSAQASSASAAAALSAPRLNPCALSPADCTTLRDGCVLIVSRSPQAGSVQSWRRILHVYDCDADVVSDLAELVPILRGLCRTLGELSKPVCIVLHQLDDLQHVGLDAEINGSTRLAPESELHRLLAPFSPLSVLLIVSVDTFKTSSIGFPNTLRGSGFSLPAGPGAQLCSAPETLSQWPPEGHERYEGMTAAVAKQDARGHLHQAARAMPSQTSASCRFPGAAVGRASELPAVGGSVTPDSASSLCVSRADMDAEHPLDEGQLMPAYPQLRSPAHVHFDSLNLPLKLRDLLHVLAVLLRRCAEPRVPVESAAGASYCPSPPARSCSLSMYDEQEAPIPQPASNVLSSGALNLGSTSPPRHRRQLSGRLPHLPLSKQPIKNLAVIAPMRILLVEDNVVNQKMMQMMLHKLGYTITVAANGEECLAQMDAATAAKGPPFDCVLMDANLGSGMSGEECARIIRRRSAEARAEYAHAIAGGTEAAALHTDAASSSALIPSPHRHYIIAQTANVSEVFERHCKEAGMDAFLAKPICLDALVATLRRAYGVLHPAAD